MAYKFMAVTRSKGKLVLSVKTEAPEAYTATTLAVWLMTVIEHYKTEGVKVQLDESAAQIVQSQESEIQVIQKSYSEPSMFLFQAVSSALAWPVNSDFDENLRVVHLMLLHADAIKGVPVERFKIGYSVKKHRTSPGLNLMTLKGDFCQAMGLQASILAICALKGAVSRERGVDLHIVNLEDVIGEAAVKRRQVPQYEDYNFWRLTRIAIEHLTERLDVEAVKKAYGSIKVLSDLFEREAVR